MTDIKVTPEIFREEFGYSVRSAQFLNALIEGAGPGRHMVMVMSDKQNHHPAFVFERIEGGVVCDESPNSSYQVVTAVMDSGIPTTVLMISDSPNPEMLLARAWDLMGEDIAVPVDRDSTASIIAEIYRGEPNDDEDPEPHFYIEHGFDLGDLDSMFVLDFS